MTQETIYHGDPYYRKFFFSTDYYQELDDEENFIPVERKGPLEEVRSELLQIGYTEIPNPDPKFAPKGARMPVTLKLVPRTERKHVGMIEIRDSDYPCALIHINAFWLGQKNETDDSIYDRLNNGETIIVKLEIVEETE